jgi:hypothetical protein
MPLRHRPYKPILQIGILLYKVHESFKVRTVLLGTAMAQELILLNKWRLTFIYGFGYLDSAL